MTNAEKYKEANERARAFEKFCHKNSGLTDCHKCPLESLMPDCGDSRAQFAWLDLEAEEEKPLPCPFCGGEVEVQDAINGGHWVLCKNEKCLYSSGILMVRDEAISAHNRMAKAVMESKKEAINEKRR